MPDDIVIPSTKDAARIVHAVKRVEAMPVRLPAGPDDPDRFRDSVPIYNDSGHAIPEGGVIHMNGMQANEVQHLAYRPIAPFFDDFGIACTPVPDGTLGRAWIAGDRQVLLSVAEWAACAVGEWIIATTGAFTAHVFVRGNMLILRKLTSPYVFARLRDWEHG